MTEKRSGIVFRIILAVLGILYFAVLVKLLFVKNGVRMDTDALVYKPFKVLSEYRDGTRSLKSVLINYAGNMCLFLPLGLLLPAVFKKLNFPKTVILGFFVILAAEALQYATKSGYADIDDVLANTLGFVLGAFIYFYILGGKRKSAVSYILTLVLVVAVAVFALGFISKTKPEMIPGFVFAKTNKIACMKISDYDVKTQIYKMSHGEVFVDKGIAEDKDGNKTENPPKTYFFADTCIFVTAEGGNNYKIQGIEEMLAEVESLKPVEVRLWLDTDGKCKMVLLEKE